MFARFQKLKKVKSNLETLYQKEFLFNLISQATDRKSRYAKVTHKELEIGDLVSIKSDFMKPFDYPLGIVKEIEKNDLGEVVTARVRKANGEVVRRHVENLIFLTDTSLNFEDSNSQEDDLVLSPDRPPRTAAQICKDRNRDLIEQHLI